ncbi:MAG TPA: hypothetical protein VD866_04335 [Urbifossiella sp.]|nr:hypothetical protein [Urbifossiella sp.]
MPRLRPADDQGHESPRDNVPVPGRRRRADDNRTAAKAGGWRRLPVLLMVAVGLLVLVFAVVGVMTYQSSGPQLTMVEGSRDTSPQGGTTSVTLNLRAAADSPGGQVSGKYYFLFSAGTRTTVADANVVGRAGVVFRQTFFTPDLANEPGPVTFWVEQRDGDSVSRVSPTYTIP